MLYNHSLAFSQKSQLTDHYLTSIMYLIMHLLYTARDITSHALGTIMSSMGPYGVLGALGTSAMTYLLLQMLLADDSTSPRGRRASPEALTAMSNRQEQGQENGHTGHCHAPFPCPWRLYTPHNTSPRPSTPFGGPESMPRLTCITDGVSIADSTSPRGR